MTNHQQAESFQGSDNTNSGSNTPENFVRDFMKDFMREFPNVWNEIQNSQPDVSNHLPGVELTDTECDGDGGGDTQNPPGSPEQPSNPGTDQPPANPEIPPPSPEAPATPSPETPPVVAPPEQPSPSLPGEGPEANAPEERQPYNLREAGARILAEKFPDNNGDNRVSKDEVRKFLRDEVQNPFDRLAIRNVLNHWESTRNGAKDGRHGVSRADLDETIERQVQRGILNRYPGPSANA
ncbi:MAG: hypothetical protein SGJ27_18715 [Candidatus Melainabacteria bacterium]|nr:hypothetical protein [Candidatus Melainabacteria bacterium]